MAEIGKMRYHPSYRIGSERYNEYLTDLFTGFYYDRMVPFEDDLEKEAAYGERMWQSQMEATPDELLWTAVIGRAVVDLLELAVRHDNLTHYGQERSKQIDFRQVRRNAQIREIVEFLEQYDAAESVLIELAHLLRTKDPDWLLCYVKRSYSRFLGGLGKKERRSKRETMA